MQNQNESQLQDAVGLLNAVWPEKCRPSLRWLRDRQEDRSIPFIKIRHKVFFDPAEVRRVLLEKHTVKARGAR